MATSMHLSTSSILRLWFWGKPYRSAFKSFTMLMLLVLMCIATFPTIQYQWSDATVYDMGLYTGPDACWGLVEQKGLHWDRAGKPDRLTPQGVFAYIMLIVTYL
ncbi:hypothetical protein BS50DRAFT_633057 [Corynespora cassiicola Philippines]|uniref:Uncharacterized protein n=1 Tax=Corynespora cassiicola Philippines TaxID=1448308 RepID=A0A2T2NV84_CORCC|nr:hypothetical protein BS50DRAFT_633057 [Corynespora cassiicola Philippines]